MANTQKYLNHLLQTVGITPACSEEEREAADEIARIFSNHGFDPEIQEFTSSASPKIVRAILCCVMFVAAVLMGIGGLIGVVGTILVFASGVLFVLERLGRITFPQVGAGGLSQNVIAYHKASGPLASPRNRPVVVIAHYDSPRGDILSSGPLAAYRPLLVKLLPFAMAAPVIIAVVRLLPLPAAAKIALWVVAIIVSLIPLLYGVAAILNRSVLPYTTGSVCNKSSVAAMLGVMDAVSPFAGRDEFPADRPFDEYMDEQRSMYVVDEYADGAVPPIPTGARAEDDYVNGEQAVEQPMDEALEQPATYADGALFAEVAEEDEVSLDEEPLAGDTVAMPALDYADRIEVESYDGALAADEGAADVEMAPAVEEVPVEPESDEPALPVNAAGCIRYGADALRSLGMVAASCAIEYEADALPVVAAAADAVEAVAQEPVVEQVAAAPVRSVADVPVPEVPAHEPAPIASEPVERPSVSPVAAPVVPPAAVPVVPMVAPGEPAPVVQQEPIEEAVSGQEAGIESAPADETVAFAAYQDDEVLEPVEFDEVDTGLTDPFAAVPDMEAEPVDDQIDWAYHGDADDDEIDDIDEIEGAVEAEFELLDDDEQGDEAEGGYAFDERFEPDEDVFEPVDEGVAEDEFMDEAEFLDEGEIADVEAADAMVGIVEDIDESELEADEYETLDDAAIDEGYEELEPAVEQDDVVEEASEDVLVVEEPIDESEPVEVDEQDEDWQDDDAVSVEETDEPIDDEAAVEDAADADETAVMDEVAVEDEDDDFYTGATQAFQPISDERIETETIAFERPEVDEVADAAAYGDFDDEAYEDDDEDAPDIMEAIFEVIDDDDEDGPVDESELDEIEVTDEVQLDETTEFAAAEVGQVDETSDDEPAEDEVIEDEVADDEVIDGADLEEEAAEDHIADEDDREYPAFEGTDEIDPVLVDEADEHEVEQVAETDGDEGVDDESEDDIDRSIPLGGATQTFDVSTLVQGTQPFTEQPIDATLPRAQETVDSLMDQISAEPAARPRRSLNIPDIASTSPYIPRTVPPNVPDVDPAPRTIASAVQQQKSGSMASRSSLFDLPDPSASAADPFANVGATGPMRAASGTTAQFTVIGPNDVVRPSAPAPGTFETISAPAPQPKKKKRGLGGLFGKKKKRDESSMSDWLGVDKDYDAKRSGRDIGSWDNFEGDDGWKGGATGDASLTEADLREAITSMGDDELLGHDIWFVATGSSEHGNAGARAFLESHRDKLRGVFLINLECVGAGMLAMVATEGERRVLKGDKRIMKLVSRVSSDFHHEISSVDMPFIDTDAHAAMEMSLRSLTIAGVDGTSLACSHSVEDIPVNVSADNVALAADVVTEVIRRS